jgi:hypothetical protein
MDKRHTEAKKRHIEARASHTEARVRLMEKRHLRRRRRDTLGAETSG